MQCVILAGGVGTRMQPVAATLPKSLIPIRNRPFLHYQLSHLAKQNIRDILLCVGYGGDQIERYAEDGRAWGLTIQYVREGTELRGTGGALRLACEEGCLEPAFFVLYGDSYQTIDFLPVWQYFETRTEPAVMLLYKNSGLWDRSHAAFDGQKITHYDKKHPASDRTSLGGDLSILRRIAIEEGVPPNSVYDLDDLFQKLSERGKLAGYETKARPYAISSTEGLQDFIAYVSRTSL